MKLFRRATICILSTLLLTSLSSPGLAKINYSNNFKIKNESKFQITNEAYKKVVSEERKLNSRRNTSDVLIVDFNSREEIESLVDKHQLVIGVEEVNSEDTDLRLYWSGLNSKGVEISGKDEVFVDIDGYVSESKDEKDKQFIIQTTVLDAITDHLAYLQEDEGEAIDERNTSSLLAASQEYDWTDVEWDQVAKYYPPYGKIRLNYQIAKARSLHTSDKGNYMSSYLNAQVNPGAQLAKGDSDYDSAYRVLNIELRSRPRTADRTPFVMLDHEPVNTGRSGSTSHSGGLGFDMRGGGSFSYAYQFTQNWSDLTLSDESDDYGVWVYDVSGSLRSQVVTAKGGAIYRVPSEYSSHNIGVYAYVDFGGTFVKTVSRVANESIKVRW
ncbi:hypothetical protein NDK47_01045 [Brevibacillus ruminantium]|uniref:Uncharacterized protein n=1 Tax=Brevibacillus ruminantium TaxID=2950604 RepID=A0ABY4WFP0_9BACL|nr:hypothetical protein [Brevibacillus ruminantium]USG65975.1 hypothetical protein NDK47_01045 [Brevibacillus ruminantium]